MKRMILKQVHSMTITVGVAVMIAIQLVTVDVLAQEGEINTEGADANKVIAFGLSVAGIADSLLSPTENGSFIMPGVLLTGRKPMIQFRRRMTEETLMMGTTSNIYKEVIGFTVVMDEEEFYHGEFEFSYTIQDEGENTRSFEAFHHAGSVDTDGVIVLLSDESNKEIHFALDSAEEEGETIYNGTFHTTKIRFLKGSIDFEIPEAKEVLRGN